MSTIPTPPELDAVIFFVSAKEPVRRESAVRHQVASAVVACA